ncbi:MAG: hypothetical protein GXP24_01470 [Planctomycetes bacterium]|nr:hypothetical protein [Planctomycetota bacterium]
MKTKAIQSFVAATLVIATCTNGRAETILFESATLGLNGMSWQNVFDRVVLAVNVTNSSYQGVRFELTQPVVTTQVGGHFVAPPNSDSVFFAAIVELDNAIDFPDSEDLSTPDVLGTNLLAFPEPSGEVWADLELSLNPGWYALVFGSGLFGASGTGGAIRNSIGIDSPDYIGFQSGFGWGARVPGKRFVIKGTIVPEPTSFVLAFSASLFLLAQKRSHRI